MGDDNTSQQVVVSKYLTEATCRSGRGHRFNIGLGLYVGGGRGGGRLRIPGGGGRGHGRQRGRPGGEGRMLRHRTARGERGRGRRRPMLGEQDGQVELGHGLELEHEDLHHFDEKLFAVAALLLRALSDAFHWKN
jgi:hypothetical protein